MNDRPLTLFKYEPLSLQAIQNLKRQVVYFGSPSQFNDPFDCTLTPRFKGPTDIEASAVAAKLLSDRAAPPQMKVLLQSLPMPELKKQLLKSAQDLVQQQCEDFNNNKGISCFSEVNDNLLLWSHYGGQHRGFCLEFHTDQEPLTKLHRVTYASDIPEVDVARIMVHEDYRHVLDLFCTKSIDWSYEREWRVIHSKAGTAFTYEAIALKSIYFGAKMTDQDIDMLCLILHGQNPGVTLYRGHRSESSYKIDFEPFTYTSLADATKSRMA